jgi:hypothetical protein
VLGEKLVGLYFLDAMEVVTLIHRRRKEARILNL